MCCLTLRGVKSVHVLPVVQDMRMHAATPVETLASTQHGT